MTTDREVDRLAQMSCTACRRGEPTVTDAEIARLEVQIPDWDVIEVDEALARDWARRRGISAHPGGWETAVYQEAERQFLDEWRDEKRFIPLRVQVDWTVRHTG